MHTAPYSHLHIVIKNIFFFYVYQIKSIHPSKSFGSHILFKLEMVKCYFLITNKSKQSFE